MSRLLVVEGNQARVLNNEGFGSEKTLQNIIEHYPEVLPMDDLGVSEPLVVIGREVNTDAGSIDALCIDSEGVLVVVETKLATNPEIRRKVIGQVLEYVAQVSKLGAPDILRIADSYLASRNHTGSGQPQTLLDALNTGLDEEKQLSLYDLHARINEKLRNGRIKIVIAADNIPETLKDTVTFINRNSDFEMYVIQVHSFSEGTKKIYSPTAFGFAHKNRSSIERVQWEEESFFKAMQDLTDAEQWIIKDLFTFTQENASEIKWGTGKVSASFSYVVAARSKKVSIFAVTSVSGGGKLILNFGALKALATEHDLLSLLAAANDLPGVRLDPSVVKEGRYPNVSINPSWEASDLAKFQSAVLELQAILSQ